MRQLTSYLYASCYINRTDVLLSDHVSERIVTLNSTNDPKTDLSCQHQLLWMFNHSTLEKFQICSSCSPSQVFFLFQICISMQNCVVNNKRINCPSLAMTHTTQCSISHSWTAPYRALCHGSVRP